MLMSKYFICCEDCYAAICKKSIKAAKLWMQLCAVKMTKDVFVLENNDFPELRILENMGFLVSTDQYKSLSIKTRDFKLTEDDQPFFCVQDGRHG